MKVELLNSTERLSSVSGYFISNRWPIMLIVGAVVVTVKALEHLLIGESIITAHFLSEALIYVIGVPALAIFLLSSLDRAEEERSQLENELGTLDEFMNRLRTFSIWDDLRG